MNGKMNGNDIIKRLIVGEFFHNFRHIKYIVCNDNTLVVLANVRLDCGIIDKILCEHTFKHIIWLSFCDNGTVIDEVPRTKGKVFKVTEYIYLPSSIDEEDVPFIKEAIRNIQNGKLNDSHNNPDSNSLTVRLKTTYRLTIEENGINKNVRGEWVNEEDAKNIGLRLYKNHNQDNYTVFLVTVLRFPQSNGTVREMPFQCKINRITESKSNKNMKKNVVKINENTLKQIVAESVKKVLKEGYNQETVNEAIQALLSIQRVVDKACTQVGFNPQEGNREISKLIIQISQLIHRLEMTVHEDYYQEKWDRETHEQD